MSRRIEIFKDSARYVSSSTVAQAFDLVTGIISRRLLGPSLMGVWAFCQVLINYAKYSALGTTDAVTRDIPYYLAKGDRERAVELQNLVWTFTLFTSFLAAGGLWVYTSFNANRHETFFRGALWLTGLIIIFQRANNLLISFLRAHKNFKLISREVIYSSVLNLTLVAGLTWGFGLYGYLAAAILSFLGNILFIQYFARFSLRFSFNFEKLKPVLALGVPLLINGVLTGFFLSLDKVFITKNLGFEALGLYSIALMAQNYFISLPNMIGIVLYPYYQEQYARHESAESLNHYVYDPMFALLGLLMIPLGLIWILAPLLVQWLLPKFMGGIPALKILLAVSFFRVLTAMPTSFLITLRKEYLLIPLNLIAVLFAVIFFSISLKYYPTLECAAFSTGCVYFTQFAASLACAVHLKLSAAKAIKFMAASLTILCLGALLLTGLDHWDPGLPLWAISALRTGIFLVFMLPVLFFTEKETGALSLMKKYIYSRWQTS